MSYVDRAAHVQVRRTPEDRRYRR